MYLTLLRLCAALAVFVGHSSGFLHPFGYIATHAMQAVVAFFVLSGFVITWTAAEKERTLRPYAIARIARIYPVVVVALVTTFVGDMIGRSFAPGNYEGAPYYSSEYLGHGILSLVFVNQAWFDHDTFGSDEPFWSLGFEIPYYILFGMFFFLRGYLRIILLAAYALLIGPVVLAYSSLWLMGSLTYRLTKLNVRPAMPLVVVLIVSIVAIYPVFKHHFPLVDGLYLRTGNDVGKWIYFNAIGVMIAGSILTVHWLPPIRMPKRAAACIEWLAGGSFTLYLTHQPIIVMLNSIFPGTGALRAAAIMAATFVTCYLLAEVAERRKVIFRRFIELAFVQLFSADAGRPVAAIPVA